MLLGGCAGASAPQNGASPNASTPPIAPGTLAVTDSKGAIEGVVLDSSIRPVGGADVSLSDAGTKAAALLTMRADAAGRFGFELLDPGTYRIAAGSHGFGNASVLAVVAAGQRTSSRLVLNEVASEEPYTLVLIESGIIACGAAAVVVRLVCLPTVTGPVFGKSRSAIFFPILKGHQAAVVEQDWANRQQVLSDWFMQDSTDDNVYDGPWLGDAVGTAILRKEFLPGVFASSFAKPAHAKPIAFPGPEQNFTFLIATYFDGSYQKEANSTVPACSSNPILGYCSGAGVALQYKFTDFVTVFMHQSPPVLAAYSAIPDH
jgi:hypothetical protein